MRPFVILAAAALGGLFAASSASKVYALGYTFTDINVPGSQPGSTGFYGLTLNNLGQVAGTYFNSVGNDDGFVYAGGKYVTVDAPGAIDTYVWGINDRGQIVGTAQYSNGSQDNFIDTHGVFTVITNAISPLESNAINDRGQVLGGNYPNYEILNANGVIAPIDTSGAKGNAFIGGFNNLDQFVGTVSDSAGCCHAFIDTKGIFTKFDYPNASYTAGGGINDRGQVVGEYFDSTGGYGFLYTNGQFTTIQDPNASAAMDGTDPFAINDVGQIAGWYYDAQGNIHSFLATPSLDFFASTAAARLADPVPEPSTWAMMLVGFAGLGFLGYRQTTRRAKPQAT